jgi:hypothetical protein
MKKWFILTIYGCILGAFAKKMYCMATIGRSGYTNVPDGISPDMWRSANNRARRFDNLYLYVCFRDKSGQRMDYELGYSLGTSADILLNIWCYGHLPTTGEVTYTGVRSTYRKCDMWQHTIWPLQSELLFALNNVYNNLLRSAEENDLAALRQTQGNQQ